MKASHDEHGRREWLDSNGLRHRLDGPALESHTGRKTWAVHGKEVYAECAIMWEGGYIESNAFLVDGKDLRGPDIPVRRPRD